MSAARRLPDPRGSLAGALIALALLAACRAPAEPGPAPAEPPAAATSAPVPVPLVPGEPRRGGFGGPGSPTYTIALAAGSSLHVVVEQQGQDVAVVLLAPDGRELLRLDSPNNDRGPEELSAVAEEPGTYRLRIEPEGAVEEGGSFTVRLAEPRRATGEDRLRASACRRLSAGEEAHRRASRSPAGGPAAVVALEREAAEHLAEAVRRSRQAGDRRGEIVALLHLGEVLSAEGDTPAAEEAYRRALGGIDPPALADLEPVAANDLGLVLEDLGRPDDARAQLERALESSRRAGVRLEELSALNNLALLDRNGGELWRALLLYDQALSGARALSDPRRQATALLNEGTVYNLLGRPADARAAFAQAKGLYLLIGDERNAAAAGTGLGWALYLEGRRDEASAELGQALALRGWVADRHGEAVTLDREARVLLEEGRPDRALPLYRKALEVFEGDDRDALSAARTTGNLARALLAAGRTGEALRRFETARERLAALGDPSAEADVLFGKAQAERRLGRLEAARADAEAALERLESVREGAGGAGLRSTYLASAHDLYELAVEIDMELHQRRPGKGYARRALGVAERARSRGLLDLVAQARHGPDRESEAWKRLGRLEAEIRAIETGSGGRAALPGSGAERTETDRLHQLFLEREKVLAELEGPAPREDAAPLAADGILRLVDPGSLLLVYWLGEEGSFVWALSDGRVRAFPLPPRQAIESRVRRLHDLLAASRRPGLAGQTREVAAAASDLLLGPVADLLGERRLLVVPDGALHLLPFAVLPDPGSPGDPLLVRHEVVALPSPSVVAALRRRRRDRPPAAKTLAVLADPVFGPDDPRLAAAGRGGSPPDRGAAPEAGTRSARDVDLDLLPRLPESGREAAAIAALVPPGERWVATGFAASRDAVLAGRLAPYRIVHLATHALLDPDQPELTGVVLSRYDRRGHPRDGFLRSFEIFDLHLSADLVVLSACRSGEGRELRGEGLLGLGRSFFHAGAARLVVSLWKVDDRATAELMRRFYREMLARGRPPAAALRAAQLSLYRQDATRAPYYWGAFSLEGEWR